MGQREQDGFVMTDALAALFVLSTASAGLIGSFALARHAGGLANEKTLALLLAKDCTTTPNSANGTISLDGATFELMIHVTPLFESEAPVSYRKRECRVTWSRRGQPRDVAMTVVEVTP